MSTPEPGLTITCAEVVELVTDYLEGSLDPSVRAEVDAHLRMCEGCGIYIEQMTSTLRMLGQVPEDSLSETAKVELLAAFRYLRGRPAADET